MSTGASRRAGWPSWSWPILTGLVLLLGACGAVPTSGPIRQGPVVDSGESTQFIRVIAAPPSPGASAEGIVRGFLEASPSLEHDHAIARRYLTEQAAQEWRPGTALTVYEPASLRILTSGNRVRVRFDATGELGADGVLTAIHPARAEAVTFRMQPVPSAGADGQAPQWRISEPPGPLLVSSTDLRRAFRPYQVMFAGARSEALVPDTRLVPVVGSSLPTRLAQLVLDGPAQWLSSAVHSGLPEGGGLDVEAVPVVDGVAQVSLTEDTRMATGEDRRDLAAALTWTLTQLPEVLRVRIDAAGAPYQVPGAPEEMDRSTWLARAPDLSPLTSGGDRRPPGFVLDGDSLDQVDAPGGTTIPLDLPDAAGLHGLVVQSGQQAAAAIAGDGTGVWLMPFDASPPTLVPMGGVSDLSADVDGGVLVVGPDGIQRIVSPDQVQRVTVKPEALGPLSALSVARDGARVAAIIEGRVHLGALHRAGDRLAIEGLHPADTALSGVTALAWHDSQTLDVLSGGQSTERGQVSRLWVGTMRIDPLGSPADARELAAAPGAVTLVATADRQIMGNVGRQWRARGQGGSVAYPG